MAVVNVVIRVIFFFAVNARNKKTVRPCNFFFFCCKSCKPAYTTYSKKKKITRLDGFFVHDLHFSRGRPPTARPRSRFAHNLGRLLESSGTYEKSRDVFELLGEPQCSVSMEVLCDDRRQLMHTSLSKKSASPAPSQGTSVPLRSERHEPARAAAALGNAVYPDDPQKL